MLTALVFAPFSTLELNFMNVNKHNCNAEELEGIAILLLCIMSWICILRQPAKVQEGDFFLFFFIKGNVRI